MEKYRLPLQALAVIGFLGCWGRTLIDGTLPALLSALHGSKPYILPGTTEALKTRITGIYYPIDYLLNVLMVFFWESVDGSHPTTSAIGIYFLLQFFPILTVLQTEDARSGTLSRQWSMSAMVWTLGFQAMGIGPVGPVFVLLYLAASPLLRANSEEDLRTLDIAPSTAALLAIPGALILCYIVPGILMGLKSPGVVSNSFQQSAIVLWNTFPLWVAAAHTILETLLKPYVQEVGGSRQHMTALRIVNSIGMIVGFVGHISTLGLIAVNTVFPALFAPEYQGIFTLHELFVPPLALTPVKTVGDGVRGFMLWDQLAGYGAMLILVFAQLEKVAQIQGRRYKTFGGALAGAVCVSVLGPGATCLLTSWVRAELLHEKAEKREAAPSGHKMLL